MDKTIFSEGGFIHTLASAVALACFVCGALFFLAVFSSI